MDITNGNVHYPLWPMSGLRWPRRSNFLFFSVTLYIMFWPFFDLFWPQVTSSDLKILDWGQEKKRSNLKYFWPLMISEATKMISNHLVTILDFKMTSNDLNKYLFTLASDDLRGHWGQNSQINSSSCDHLRL